MPEPLSLLYPLDAFYAAEGLALPPVQQVDSADVPEPCRQLLVHDRDMTPTLEAFLGERIHLRVLARRRDGDAYSRQVVLTLNGSARPVEFGAIVIHLQHFPPVAREEILEGYRPLGTILHVHEVAHQSRPRAFLRLAPDAVVREALGLTTATALYGRRNVIFGPDGCELANILEILPPLQEGGDEKPAFTRDEPGVSG
jgi:chorismate-pyruvate lyase